MDVRTSPNPVLLRARRWLHLLNQRHPWNHNEHFHRWILRNLPARRRRALDLGCGTGALVQQLAPRFDHVTGIDLDEGMVAAARARLAGHPGVTIQLGSLDDAGRGNLDLITLVAVLHHLDLADTLVRIPLLLAPGGRLLVVGLAQVSSPTDVAIDCVSAVANPVIGLLKHPRRAGPHPDNQPVMPIKDPTTTYAEVVTAAKAHLPGASVRRRLFFRHTLSWTKPS